MNINGIDCKILKRESKRAEVEIEDQTILISAEVLPASAKVGEQVKLYFFDASLGQLEEKKIAKHILDEILNGS